jgi:bifunctional non-homologous end joining protein LigD
LPLPTETRPGLSSPDKLLWPEAGITKADLWDYYMAVSDRLLAEVADRPLTLKRHPDGIERSGFFQKHLRDDAPEDLHRFNTWSESSKRDVDYLVAQGVRELQWAAQMSVVELHAWLARRDKPHQPDTLLFDLDPANEQQSVAQAAIWTREVLDELGFEARVKSSGKRGLHVMVRIERRYGFDEVRGFALAVARYLADRHSDDLTVEMRKADRGGRLLVDWSRHGQAQHTVAAWSPRVTPQATVSVPLSWDEVDNGFDPSSVTIRTAPERPNLWSEPAPVHRIEAARRELTDLGYEARDRSPRARTTKR